MQFPNPKIKFYRIRTFGERLNISFDFIRETYKPLLKFSLYLILPICLFQAFSMNSYIRFAFSMGAGQLTGNMEQILTSFLMNYGVLMLCILVGSSMLSAMVYSLMQEYDRRETRLLDITLTDFKSSLIRNVVKMLRVSLFAFGAMLLLCALIGFLAWAASPWTLVVTLPLLVIGLFIVLIPLTIFTPVYLFEDLPFSAALKKSFKLGFASWGEIFLVMLVFGFIGNIINTFTTMPWYLVMIFGEAFSLAEPDSGVNSSIWYQFVTYLLGIVQAYGMYISSIVSAIGIAFQYFHIRESKEGISVKASIRNFEQL